MGFRLASSPKLPEAQLPVTVISFAAPNIGTDNFNRAYELLERKGRLRHLRVSNQGDKVSVLPPFPYNQPWNFYVPNGLNIHLGKKTMQMGYRNMKNFFTQLEPGVLYHHRLNLYLSRMTKASTAAQLSKLTLDKAFNNLFDKKTS